MSKNWTNFDHKFAICVPFFNYEVEGLSLRNPEPQRLLQLDFTQVGKKMKIGYCLRLAVRMVVNMLFFWYSGAQLLFRFRFSPNALRHTLYDKDLRYALCLLAVGMALCFFIDTDTQHGHGYDFNGNGLRSNWKVRGIEMLRWKNSTTFPAFAIWNLKNIVFRVDKYI
jgi:hypothetical protein